MSKTDLEVLNAYELEKLRLDSVEKLRDHVENLYSEVYESDGHRFTVSDLLCKSLATISSLTELWGLSFEECLAEAEDKK